MLNQIIIETIPGSNVETFIKYLQKDPMVYYVLKEWDRSEFVERYEQDLADGIVINPIDESLYSEENWLDFFKNAYTYMEQMYDITFNRIMIQATYGLEEDFVKGFYAKKITFIRDPQYTWKYNGEIIWRLKPMMHNYRKLLAKNITNLQIYEFLDARKTNLQDHVEDITEVCKTLTSFPLFYDMFWMDVVYDGVITKLMNYYLNFGIFEFDEEVTTEWYLKFWSRAISLDEKLDWGTMTFRADPGWINFTTKEDALKLIQMWYRTENSHFAGTAMESIYKDLTLTQIETLPPPI